MIVSVADFKANQGISSTASDTVFANLLMRAQNEVESYCNRQFEYNQFVRELTPQVSSRMYLDNMPIVSVSKLELMVEGVYTEQDITYLKFVHSKIWFSDGTAFNTDSLYRITYYAGFKSFTGTGTISVSLGSKAVTGVNTLFNTELAVNDVIISEGQYLIVDSITDDTHLTLRYNTIAAISSKTFTVDNIPGEVKQSIIELAAMMYLKSGMNGGRNTLGISSVNEGGPLGTTTNYKESIDWKSRLDKYKIIRI